MSRPSIQNIALSEHLTLSECHPDSECREINWWLYDSRVGMNIGMRAKTKEEALLKAINFWSKKAIQYENSYVSLKAQVDGFVNQFVEPTEDC